MKFLIAIVLTLALPSCVALTQQDKDVISASRGNAVEWNTRIQATTQPAADRWEAVKEYSRINADNWTRWDNIAHQRPMTP